MRRRASLPDRSFVTATPSNLLAAGTYTGTLKITATGANGAAANATAAAPFVIPVTLQVTAGTLVVNPSVAHVSRRRWAALLRRTRRCRLPATARH